MNKPKILNEFCEEVRCMDIFCLDCELPKYHDWLIERYTLTEKEERPMYHGLKRNQEKEIMDKIAKEIIPKKETAPKNNVAEGKPKMSLLPLDVLKKYVIPAFEEGLIKYQRESWRKGFKTSVLVDAMIRHLEEFYYQGKDYDLSSPTKKHHLSGVVFACLALLYSLENYPELDDRFGNEIG